MGSLWNPAYNSYAYTNGGSSSSYGPAMSHPPPFMDGVNDPPDPEMGAAPLTNDPNFDILEWHPAYQSCQRYFLDHAQHEPATQALCALINIRLPFQWVHNPIASSQPAPPLAPAPGNTAFTFGQYPRAGSSSMNSPNRSRTGSNQVPPTFVSLVPYIRRLVITAFDKLPILHGFFGDDYMKGVMPHVDCERRNYLFAAKHGGWRSCKRQYDSGSVGGGDESVPFMKPLDQAKMEELTAAEKAWSGWLAMEDWMVGPRAPDDNSTSSSQNQGHGVGVGPDQEGQHNPLGDGMPNGVGEGAYRA